jgi:hypothetical protein
MLVHEVETILGLLVAVAVLATAAGRIGVPYPILLVLGGSSSASSRVCRASSRRPS